MSDANAGKKMQAHFAVKGVVVSCPMCKTERWGMLQKDDEALLIGLEKVPPAYVLICMNCGFVRMHVRDVLDDLSDVSMNGEVEP